MTTQRGCVLLAWLLAALGLLMAQVALVDASSEAPAVQIPVALTAGGQYVITGLSKSATPAVRILNNPHALVVNGDKPGELVLVGAEAGHWRISAERADGTRVDYDVTISSLGHALSKPLEPGTTPPALGAPELSGAAGAKPAALDAGSGPLSTPPAASAKAAATGTGTKLAAASPPAASAAPAAPSAPGALAAAGPASLVAPAGAALTSAAPAAAPLASQSFKAPMVDNQYRGNVPVVPASPNRPAGLHYLPEDAIEVMAANSQVFDFPSRIRRVAIADSKIADIQVVNPFEINLVGHQPGFTTLTVWDEAGRYLERQVKVERNGPQQVMLNVIVAELNRSRIENQGTNFSAAFSRLGLSLVGMPGAVGTQYSPQANIVAQGIAGVGAAAIMPPPGVMPSGGQIINMLLSPNITYGLAMGNNNYQTQAFFQYLEQHQLGKILAQPHLLANSGEKAQFLSGGEIPIVVAQALNTSVVFKQFGTSVVFVPTVVGRDEVELAVQPEVSEPDYTHGVQLFGFTIPAFVTRKAQTDVRLRDHQTLIIAGLILDSKVEQVDKVPYLGDLPFAGGLFRNTGYTDQKTDLVMSVTPEIVAPLPPGGQVFMPVNRGPLSTEEIRTKAVYPPDASRPRF